MNATGMVSKRSGHSGGPTKIQRGQGRQASGRPQLGNFHDTQLDFIAVLKVIFARSRNRNRLGCCNQRSTERKRLR